MNKIIIIIITRIGQNKLIEERVKEKYKKHIVDTDIHVHTQRNSIKTQHWKP